MKGSLLVVKLAVLALIETRQLNISKQVARLCGFLIPFGRLVKILFYAFAVSICIPQGDHTVLFTGLGRFAEPFGGLTGILFHPVPFLIHCGKEPHGKGVARFGCFLCPPERLFLVPVPAVIVAKTPHCGCVSCLGSPQIPIECLLLVLSGVYAIFIVEPQLLHRVEGALLCGPGQPIRPFRLAVTRHHLAPAEIGQWDHRLGISLLRSVIKRPEGLLIAPGLQKYGPLLIAGILFTQGFLLAQAHFLQML